MTDTMARPAQATARRLAFRTARRLTAATAELTGPLSMQPDFLIVGAQRCGTTSMFKTLMQHPQVLPPLAHKGVHYFDKAYDRGHRWYRGHFPLTATGAVTGLLQRSGPGRVITGESSPYYMFHPLARQRIAADLPGVKLIVMLRDPVVRAYSGHSHERARGFEGLGFEEALEAEPMRLEGAQERLLADPGYDSFHWQHHAYVTRGQYIEQLLALERLVGRERLCVVDSGDFFTEPEPTWERVRQFLGLAPCGNIAFEQHNARQRSPLSDGLRERLERHFAPYDEALEAWWGRTPSWRRAAG